MEDRIVDGMVLGALLTIIILRLFDVITWPWIWVLVPIWGSLGLGLVIAVILLILIVIRRAWRD